MAITFNDNMPEFAGENAQPYVEKTARLCPHCKCAQTNVQSLRKLTLEFKKNYVKFVWNFVEDNNIKLFSKKELMKKMNINYISNGVLQDKALAVLILLGFIRKEVQTFVDDKGKEKDRNIYIVHNGRSPVCYNSDKDRHKAMDWINDGIKKEYCGHRNG